MGRCKLEIDEHEVERNEKIVEFRACMVFSDRHRLVFIGPANDNGSIRILRFL